MLIASAAFLSPSLSCCLGLGLSLLVLLNQLIHLVLLFQHGHSSVPVVANASCLPSTIVARGVGLVQLVAKVFVPAHVKDGNAEGPLSSGLCVGLLDVTEPGHELLAGDGLTILVLIPLTYQPQFVGKKV